MASQGYIRKAIHIFYKFSLFIALLIHTIINNGFFIDETRILLITSHYELGIQDA